MTNIFAVMLLASAVHAADAQSPLQRCNALLAQVTDTNNGLSPEARAELTEEYESLQCKAATKTVAPMTVPSVTPEQAAKCQELRKAKAGRSALEQAGCLFKRKNKGKAKTP